MNTVLILTNGFYGDYAFCKKAAFCKQAHQYEYIICADKGMHHARILGIKPDLIVGDFDSVDSEDLAYFKALDVPFEKYNPHKDATDTEIAVMKALALTPKQIIIWGGVGSRLDHSLGNVALLYKMHQQGVQGILINPYNEVYLIEHRWTLRGRKNATLSLIPFGGCVRGITTKGLEYPLQQAPLVLDTSLGISNVICEDEVCIHIEAGMLLVILAKDE